MTKLLRFALSALLFAAPIAAQTTTVLVVRHAEKAASPAADPPLTAAGSARADALAETLKDAGVTTVISTQFERTRMTALPLATRLGLTIETVDARAPQHARALADEILRKHRGETVLVSGHSNTVPDIVAALGALKPADICDGEYDNLFVVTIPATGSPSVVRLHYGAASVEKGCKSMN